MVRQDGEFIATEIFRVHPCPQVSYIQGCLGIAENKNVAFSKNWDRELDFQLPYNGKTTKIERLAIQQPPP